MAVRAAATTVSLGGTATTMTNAACTALVAEMRYQITDASKRAIDPATAVVVNVDGDPAPAANFSVDYCAGIVEFTDSVGSSVVTVSGKFIPLLPVAEAFSADIEHGYDSADGSVFGDTAARKVPTQAKASGSLEIRSSLGDDLDPGTGTRTLREMLAEPAVFIEVAPGGVEKFRAWAKLDPASVKASQTDLVGTSLKWTGVVRTCAGRVNDQALFGWS